MTKKTKKAQESLVKTSKKASIELSEAELNQVAAGRKAGKDQQEYLKIELTDVLISG
jgi:hypothetical protein